MRMCTHLAMMIIIIMKQNNFTNITHLRAMNMGIIFFSSLRLNESGSFTGVYYMQMVCREFILSVLVNCILTQTIECKMHDIETDTSRPRFKQIQSQNFLKNCQNFRLGSLSFTLLFVCSIFRPFIEKNYFFNNLYSITVRKTFNILAHTHDNKENAKTFEHVMFH